MFGAFAVWLFFKFGSANQLKHCSTKCSDAKGAHYYIARARCRKHTHTFFFFLLVLLERSGGAILVMLSVGGGAIGGDVGSFC
mmetsp:Transcript_137027/g.309500  ORF Transcript_137027/g.309500 Transcript_137027/m.309500 type:complete len:83 (-) Transcript_137027:77-325(-)